jgi:hypothetical protein
VAWGPWERVASRRGANLLRTFLQRVRRLLAHSRDDGRPSWRRLIGAFLPPLWLQRHRALSPGLPWDDGLFGAGEMRRLVLSLRACLSPPRCSLFDHPASPFLTISLLYAADGTSSGHGAVPMKLIHQSSVLERNKPRKPCSCSAIRSAVLASSSAPENAAACSTNPAMFCRTTAMRFSSSLTVGPPLMPSQGTVSRYAALNNTGGAMRQILVYHRDCDLFGLANYARAAEMAVLAAAAIERRRCRLATRQLTRGRVVRPDFNSRMLTVA